MYAYTGYDFKLPVANAYDLTLSVLGAPKDGGGPALLSFWNCRDETLDAASVASTASGWSSTRTTAGGHVENGHVWAYVHALGDNGGNFDAAKVQLTYRYGILK